jgi:acylphosphatase
MFIIRSHLECFTGIPVPPPAPAPAPVVETRQYDLYHVNGALTSLSSHKGFRNYVKHRAINIGVKGFIWRVPDVHAIIIFSGTHEQVRAAEEFLREMQKQGMIEAIARTTPEKQPFDGFSVLPSVRSKVQTGVFSEKALDDVVSQSSADQPMFRGAPSPYSNKST